jgi:hypothetical protein
MTACRTESRLHSRLCGMVVTRMLLLVVSLVWERVAGWRQRLNPTWSRQEAATGGYIDS